MQILLRKYKINSRIYPLNVYVSTNNQASISWHLNIQNFKNIRRFYELCKEFITVSYKEKKIKDCIERQKRNHIPMNLRFLHYLVNALEIESTKHYFISKNLIETINRKEKDVANTIGNLSSLGFIKQTGKEGRFKRWVISEKGNSYIEKYNINKEEFDYLFS